MSEEFNAEYVARLREKMIRFEHEVQLIKTKYAVMAQEIAKSIVHVRSGRLRDSIQGQVLGSKIVLSASTPYAGIEESRHPYIEPTIRMLTPSLEAELRGLQSKVFDQ